MSRRILLVEANEDGTLGGSSRALLDIATHLDRTRFEPVVALYQHSQLEAWLRAAGVEVHVVEHWRSRERIVMSRTGLAGKVAAAGVAAGRRWRFLRRLGVDLLHLNNVPILGYDDWLPAARLAGVPCIAHARGPTRLPRRALQRWLVRRYDAYLAISEHIRQGLLEAGMPARRTYLVYDGVDGERLLASAAGDRAELRHALGVAADDVLVLMPGNLREWKGQHVLLDALSQLPAELLQCTRVLVVGGASKDDDDYVRRLAALVAEHRLEPRVTFLGPRDDVPNLMIASDIVMHASTRPEPFGLVVVEAMALGRAVIAAAAGGPSEVVAPGCGVLVPPSDARALAGALGALIADAAARDALGAAARERAGHFAFSRTIRRLEAIYDRLLSPGARGAPMP